MYSSLKQENRRAEQGQCSRSNAAVHDHAPHMDGAHPLASAFPFERYVTVSAVDDVAASVLPVIAAQHLHLDILPPGEHPAELYLAICALENKDDSACMALLSSVRKTIGTRTASRFLILESVADQAPPDKANQTRSGLDYARLLANAGFILDRLQPVRRQMLIIARPF